MTLPGSHAPATARPRQRDPNSGQPATGRTVPEAVAPSLLSPRTGRLLVENSMIDANPQVPQDRLPGQPDNQVPGSVGKEPVGERAGQVRVKQQGPASAAADQQGAGREVDVPLLPGHSLTDTQAGPPHDECRLLGAAKPQGRKGVEKSLDLLGVPAMAN